MYTEVHKTAVTIRFNKIELKGDLSLPDQAHSLILFAHGSGSSRISPRNQMVATYLNDLGMATFLFDLLTYEEDKDYTNRFNIPLLAQRLKDVTDWIQSEDTYEHMKIGYFGASTGAAAALMAARDMKQISAIVSRGGRPDLAMSDLPFVKAPTLLIVGGLDNEVIQLNKEAYEKLRCEKQLKIVPGATHLFEEKGTMEKVCMHAANWFEMHLQPLQLHN